MTRNPKEIEKNAIALIEHNLNYADKCEVRLPKETCDWAQCATALALHRLANAWERRVEIAEATAKQKGINP